jgi:DNA-directed RNA polymerase sigma subunit (sigma70/sigma32)
MPTKGTIGRLLSYAQMNERQRIARQLVVDQKKTYEEAGRILGISRQRVHQLLTGYKSPFDRKRQEKRAKIAA